MSYNASTALLPQCHRGPEDGLSYVGVSKSISIIYSWCYKFVSVLPLKITMTLRLREISKYYSVSDPLHHHCIHPVSPQVKLCLKLERLIGKSFFGCNIEDLMELNVCYTEQANVCYTEQASNTG